MGILVTGGAGFIGSHLCEELLDRENEVLSIDNYDSYYDPSLKEKNMKNCLSDKNFVLEKVDIRNGEEIARIFRDYEIDKVVHLAARAGVRASVENPQVYERVNVGGTLNLLESARKDNIKNFIFGSSSSVYGDIDVIPFRESGPKNPISPYSASKLCAEKFCKTYSELHDMNVTVLRFFTVYGPRQRPNMAIHKFTRLIEQGKKIPMYGDGSSERDYTYIDDIISGITSAMEKNLGYEEINLGNNKTVQLRELISIIEKNLGKEARINQQPMPDEDMQITHADISKAKKLLGYEPKTSIEEGIKKFVNWYKKDM